MTTSGTLLCSILVSAVAFQCSSSMSWASLSMMSMSVSWPSALRMDRDARSVTVSNMHATLVLTDVIEYREKLGCECFHRYVRMQSCMHATHLCGLQQHAR